jgi:hypothetical protein
VVLGGLALATAGGDERRAALVEAEALLAAGSLGHNHLLFYRDAIDSALGAGEWSEAERYAAALEAYTQPEPLPWADFFSVRGRALAAFGAGRRDPDTLALLEQARERARPFGWLYASPIEKALRELSP